VLEAAVINKKEFVNRVSRNLNSNIFVSRILCLKLLSLLPTFLADSLDIQHKILQILKTSKDDSERRVANETIS
jgi:hypothetical protein